MFPTPAPTFQHAAKSRIVRVPDWPRLPADIHLYRTSMVGTDSRGYVYLVHRGENPMLRLNPDGTLNRILGADVHKKSVFIDMSSGTPRPMEEVHYLHGLHVDSRDNVWVTDVGRHLVMCFNPEGELTLTLGVDGKAGCDQRHFNQPTHAITVPSGEIFVTDGYANSRVVKFTADGKFIKDWGVRGTEPGQFHTPHVLALDRAGRLYVSDRENDRIQIFDQEGKVLEVWSNLHSIDGLHMASDGQLWSCSGVDHALLRFGPRGQVEEVWTDASKGDYPDRFQVWPDGNIPHGIWVDPAGFIYVAEVTSDKNPASPMFRVGRLLKLRRKPD